MSKNLLKRFCHYTIKRYGLDQLFDSVRDGRRSPQHKLPDILWKVTGGIITGLGSFNQMEEAIRDGDFKYLGSKKIPSADTLSRALEVSNLEDLKMVNDEIVTQARRNKSLRTTTVDGYKVVAIDGSGVFATRSTNRGKHSHCRRDVHGERTAENLYLENVLAVSYVGERGPKPILALERIPKGAGESTIAVEVLQDLYRRHWRYCDIVTMDAGFAGAPVLNEIVGQNKDYVVRVKQERYSIISDADALFEGREPDHVYKDIQRCKDSRIYYDLEIWEDEDFSSWSKLSKPPRCLKVKETRRTVDAWGETIKAETITTHFVTSCPMANGDWLPYTGRRKPCLPSLLLLPGIRPR